MEIRNILAFQKTYELNSFSKAAYELGYSQSTITIQIKQLENELNVKLFDRIGKTIQLTEDGENFLPYATKIITTANNAKQALAHDTVPRGKIIIGILESLCISHLPKVLKSYHLLFPNVSTIIKIGTFNELENMLNANMIDILWTFDSPIESDEWHKIYCYNHSIPIICSPNHKFALKSVISLNDLKNESFILTEKTCSYRTIFENHLTSLGYHANVFLEIGNTEIIKKFVASDLALSLLPEFTIIDELKTKKLCTLNVSDFKLQMQGQLFVHKNKWITTSIREFINLVKEDIRS